ncbi:MAG: hypothetical protein HKN67_10390, partial [Saprospiraceae bacterium]|nr:hypothetical protein [Saprospiraceae bacterium]
MSEVFWNRIRRESIIFKEYVICSQMYRFCFIFVSCIIIITGCNEDLSRNYDHVPLDYLKDQRFFPYGHIDRQAYRSAVLNLNEFMDKSNTGFSEAWLSRGPKNISGRVTDIEMHHSDTMTIYVGTASGGILKSTDQGFNWKPIFDQQDSLSIGDIALSPGDKNVIIAGTGEANAGGSSVT